jgi:hypothetical protein
MRHKLLIRAALFMLLLTSLQLSAQEKLSLSNIRSIYLRNTGTIVENTEIKGYYAFYQSDKIDKHTNEYTLQIIDNNLNKIKDIVFTDDKNVQLLESAYNGSTIMFLFYNSKEKTLEYRSYGFDGKEKMTYTKELDKRSKELLETTYGQKHEDGQNEALFDIEGKGYVATYPIREKKYYSYEVNMFFTDRKKQWTFEAVEEQDDKWASAVYLGATNDLVLLEVGKKKHLTSQDTHVSLLGLNINTGSQVFELNTEATDYTFCPMNIVPMNGSTNFLVMGTYYKANANVTKDNSLGLAVYEMNAAGKIVNKKYNSWAEDVSKYLPIDKKGNVDNIGYLFFHKIIQTEDGSYFAVGEGYRKTVSALGVISQSLSLLGGHAGGGGPALMKLKITDMVVMKFSKDFSIQAANIYDKHNNSMEMPMGLGWSSPHTMALVAKGFGGFDYCYTQTDKDRSSFVVGYNDYEKSDDYSGSTFHTISYSNNKMTLDKINLKSKASRTKVFPAKTGSVMIMEYFKKDKKLEMRLEKVN